MNVRRTGNRGVSGTPEGVRWRKEGEELDQERSEKDVLGRRSRFQLGGTNDVEAEMRVWQTDKRRDRTRNHRKRRYELLDLFDQLLLLSSFALAAVLGRGRPLAVVVGGHAARHLCGPHLLTDDTLRPERQRERRHQRYAGRPSYL